MTVVMDCELVFVVKDYNDYLPDCRQCFEPFNRGQIVMVLYERNRRASYMIHPACEIGLVNKLESELGGQ